MKRLTYLFLSLGMVSIAALNSCDPVEKPLPTLEITQDEVSVPAEGGQFTIDYVLENPQDGVLPTVTPVEDCDWVSDFAASDGVISFTVAANESTEARECKVNVSYPQVTQDAVFTIRQQGTEPEEPEPVEPKIDITIKGYDATTITADIIPSDNEMMYYLGIEQAGWLEENGFADDDEAFFSYLLEYLEGQISSGKQLSDILYQGEQTDLPFINCYPETEYVIYAFGLDASTKEMTTDMVRVSVTTGAIEMIDVNFDIKTQYEGNTLTITAVPENYDGYFYIDIYQKFNMEAYEEQGISLFEICDSNFKSVVEVYQMFLGWSIEEILEYACYKGENNTRVCEERLAEMEYTILVFAVTNTGYANSEPSVAKVTTGPSPVQSDNEITINVEKVNNNSATVKFKTTNSDPYYYRIFTAQQHEEMFAGYTDADIMNYIIYYWLEESYIGDQTAEFTDLIPETEYYIYAFGVDIERSLFTTSLKVSDFKATNQEVSATFNAEFDKYYDIQEILAIDPSWKDKVVDFEYYDVVMPITVTTEPEGCEYYYSILRTEYYGDYTDEDFYDLIGGPYTETTRYYLGTYSDFEFMLVGAAKDADGNWGPVQKYENVRFPKDGVSDAQEFVDTYK